MLQGKGPSRRDLIKLGVAGGLTASLPAAAAASDTSTPTRKRHTGRPRNIIFMVSDGMSMGALSMAEPFSQLVRDRGTRWHALLQDPNVSRGYFDTSSLSSPVTDSAAAATAWSSGSRVFNGSLNVLPDGRELTPIAPLVRQTGRRVGLVTTTRMTHATPAGFAAVHRSRAAEDDIAVQYACSVDVLMGGGRKHFDPAQRDDQRDVIQEYRDGGYAFWDQRSQVTGSTAPEKVLGLFWDDHIPYTLDHNHQRDIAAKVPTLAEMTSKALEILARHDDGFLLQVEGGRVDHAAHANDAGAILWDQLAFDDAIAVAERFCAAHPDTLLIVTTDHGNANPGLNGMGKAYGNTSDAFARLAQASASYEHMLPRLKDGSRDVLDVVRQGTGLDLTANEVAPLRAALAGELPPELSRQHANLVGVMGQIIGNHTSVGWTGVSHTQDLVVLSALGPGAERFAGLMRNTDACGRMYELFGIDHRNPQMTPEEAARFAVAMPPGVENHWT
jgi:alkaline phosphatase